MPSSTWKESAVDASDTQSAFMTNTEWKDDADGHEGCLTSLVRPLAVSIGLVVTVILAYQFGAPAIVAMWWS